MRTRKYCGLTKFHKLAAKREILSNNDPSVLPPKAGTDFINSVDRGRAGRNGNDDFERRYQIPSQEQASTVAPDHARDLQP